MGYFDVELMARFPEQKSVLRHYITVDQKPLGRNGALKRTMDLVASLCAIVFLLPLFAIVAVGIKLTSKGPVLFKQKRLGKYGRHYSIYKFRTMHLDGDDKLQSLLASCPISRENWNKYQKLENDPRITRLGSFLRRSSIDELPQLINVVRGEMSLVGHRPILPEQKAMYGKDNILHYIRSRPGLTGLWQISGRNSLPFERRAELDVEYSKRWSFLLDLKILVKTIPALLFADGAY